MNSILPTLLALPLALVAQVFSSIPEVPIQLTLFSPSSGRQDTTTKLSAPAALAVARSGNIYVFDDGNSRIVKLNPSGKFIAEFGGPSSGLGAIQRRGLGGSIAVDKNENVYVGDPVTPKVQVFTSNGQFIRSFRVPFPVTSIAINTKQEIHVAVSANSPTKLILAFSENGKFLRQFGERLVTNKGRIARSVNQVVIACDSQDNLYVAFRSWPVIRKYSPSGMVISEQQFQVPSELVSEAERKNFSLDFIGRNSESSFVVPLLTHSIAVSGNGRGYLLLNAHSVVVFAANGRVIRQFRFRAPLGRDNLFIRLAGNFNSGRLYLLDIRSGEIYEARKL